MKPERDNLDPAYEHVRVLGALVIVPSGFSPKPSGKLSSSMARKAHLA